MERDEARQLTINFKAEQMDPGRRIVTWERKTNVQKRLKL